MIELTSKEADKLIGFAYDVCGNNYDGYTVKCLYCHEKGHYGSIMRHNIEHKPDCLIGRIERDLKNEY